VKAQLEIPTTLRSGAASGDRRSTTRRLPAKQPTVSIMGLPLHSFDHDALIEAFLERACNGDGGWIVTPNLDILRQFTASTASRELVMAATYRVADGVPIVWASRLAGTPVPERIAGSDLVHSMPQAAARARLSVFLLGGNPGVAAAAATRLEADCPGLPRVGSYCPPIGFEDDPEELKTIMKVLRSAQPALVLVGLGFPKQERLIRLLRTELPGAWFVGVGVSLSFLAGDQPRAPIVLQSLGLEWAHRLWHEPRRLFRRYIVEGVPFALKVFAWGFRERLLLGLAKHRGRRPGGR
jgi:N-acetylglucosaminyldiphosphoundecaprenol N-acetyl-beta-D-mannosaminyltransferase